MKILTSKHLMHLSLVLVIALLATACAAPAAPATSPTEAPAAQPAAAGPMDELIAAAQAEGMLTTIALPHDWCNYGEMIETFKTKYGLEVDRRRLQLWPHRGIRGSGAALQGRHLGHDPG